MEKLLLIKLGGSLVTDKSKRKTANREAIAHLAKEIRIASKRFAGKLIVAHGAGSFAHQSAAKYKVNEGLQSPLQFKGLPYVASDAIELNRIVIGEFLESDLSSVSFSPESMIFSENRKPKSVYTDPLIHALNLGFLPILYGDTIFDKKIGFLIYSTEMVLGALAKKMTDKYKISFIYCTDTDGVHDAKGKTISEINKNNIHQVEKYITGTKKTDVTGGMIHKVRESLVMAGRGHETIIINGNRNGELKKAILGEKHHGTLISS